jgi:hypothetical protein
MGTENFVWNKSRKDQCRVIPAFFAYYSAMIAAIFDRQTTRSVASNPGNEF